MLELLLFAVVGGLLQGLAASTRDALAASYHEEDDDAEE